MLEIPKKIPAPTKTASTKSMIAANVLENKGAGTIFLTFIISCLSFFHDKQSLLIMGFIMINNGLLF